MARRFILPCLCLFLLAGIGGSAQGDEKRTSLFDGRSLDGWEVLPADRDWWKVQDGVITAGSLEQRVPRNMFLATKATYRNFDLKLKIRLRGKKGFINSGIQFRSVRMPNSSEMIGYQADAGKGWWGKLYDESRRRKVIAEPVEPSKVAKAVRTNEWNEYRIRAEGRRIRTWINGILAIDYTEPDTNIPLEGKIGLQVHGGGKVLVEFKDLSIVRLP